MGATFTFRRYTRGWYNNGGRLLRWEVSGIDKRTVFVREIKVTTDYISKLYHDGVKLYAGVWQFVPSYGNAGLVLTGRIMILLRMPSRITSRTG